MCNDELQGEHQNDPHRPRDFAVIVVDSQGNVIGRLTVWDVLKGLEVQEVKKVDSLSMVEGYNIWRQPSANLATKAHYILVKNLVKRLPKHEFIDENAPLDQAIKQLLKHRSLSLISSRKIIRLLKSILSRKLSLSPKTALSLTADIECISTAKIDRAVIITNTQIDI